MVALDKNEKVKLKPPWSSNLSLNLTTCWIQDVNPVLWCQCGALYVLPPIILPDHVPTMWYKNVAHSEWNQCFQA